VAKRPLNEYASELDAIVSDLASGQLRVSFDGLSDTLYIDLHERANQTTNVYVSDGWMYRVDRESDEVRGLQIDNVLAHAINVYPVLGRLLLIAEDLDDYPELTPIERSLKSWSIEHSHEALAELPELLATGD